MATFQDIDVPLCLSRLRPTGEYQWIGQNGDSGYSSLSECIGEWRDTSTVIPTDAEMLAEWDIYLSELEAAQAEEQQRQQDLQALQNITDMLQTIADERAVLDTDKQTLIADIQAFDAATNAQRWDMLKALMQDTRRILNREDNALVRERKTLRAVRRLVKWKLNDE